MKKRLLSIFLIVSIIISVCVVGMVSSSAYSSYISGKVQLTQGDVHICKYGVHIGWTTRDVKGEEGFCIWAHEWGTPKTQWKSYYVSKNHWTQCPSTNCMFGYYGKVGYNLTGLKNKNYDIKISAVDRNGNHSRKYSDVVVVNPAFPQKPHLAARKTQLNNSYDSITLGFSTQNYNVNHIGFQLANYNRTTKKFKYATFTTNGSRAATKNDTITFVEKKGLDCAYQVRMICSIDGRTYYSAWSNAAIPK